MKLGFCFDKFVLLLILLFIILIISCTFSKNVFRNLIVFLFNIIIMLHMFNIKLSFFLFGKWILHIESPLRAMIETWILNIILCLSFHLKESNIKLIFNEIRKARKTCRVWHIKLISFQYSLFNIIIVAKSLPLSIHWIYWSAWKVSLLYESMPVNLILIFFRWKILHYFKYFNKLSNCKSCSLAPILSFNYLPLVIFILNFYKLIRFIWNKFFLHYHVFNPSKRINHTWKIILIFDLISFKISK